MKKAMLIMLNIAAIFCTADSWAYSNECVKSGSGSNYYIDCYDKNGNQISNKYYKGDPDNGGRVVNSYTYTYDSNDNKILYKSYDGDLDNGANVDYTSIYTYDANGNRTSEKNYSGDPDNGVSAYSAYTYTYDSNGNQISKTRYSFNSDGGGTVRSYTCNGSYSAKCGGSTLISTETFTAEQNASIFAGFPTNYFPLASSAPKPKRTYYTIEEAMGHLSHDNNNRVIFTFK